MCIRDSDAISLEVMPGEILSVLGENGAGKSTLMKIIFGSVTPDEGEIYFDGRKVNISSPADARELGIAMVFQHFVLFETLTAKENILLGMPEGTDPVSYTHLSRATHFNRPTLLKYRSIIA